MHNMSQQAELTPKEGEELFAAVADNKHNKTYVSPVGNSTVRFQENPSILTLPHIKELLYSHNGAPSQC